MGRIGVYGAAGRIGKLVTRLLFGDQWMGRLHPSFLVASKGRKAFSYALRCDSVHGPYGPVLTPGEGEDAGMVINGQAVATYFVRNPREIPWQEHGEVDVLIDCTGMFKSKERARVFLDCGAKRVLIPAPASGPVDGSFVWGVNHTLLTPDMQVVSPTSCTTNGLAPAAMVLHEEFGIEQGTFVTVHAVTQDQNLMDGSHGKDPRRGRSAGNNIVPTSTGAAASIGRVIPELDGRLAGTSLRVPVQDGSLLMLTVTLMQSVEIQDVVDAFYAAASEGPLKGVLECTNDPIVSSDIIGNPHSAIVDIPLIQKVGLRTFLIAIWYDNEFAFANRLLQLAHYMAQQNR